MPYERPPPYRQPGASGGAAGLPPVRISGIPDGYAGTEAIVGHMRRLAVEGLADERIHQLARQVAAPCAPRAWHCEAEALLRHVQREFRYTRLPWHPAGCQRVQTAAYTLLDAPTRSGECASLSVALASLLMAMGFEVRFRTAGTDPADPRFFEHVLVLAHVPDEGWLPADPSYDRPLGWEHPAGVVRQDWGMR